MSLIDIIIIIAFVPAVIKGIKDGFIRQIAGIAGLFLGVWLSYKFSSLITGWLGQWINANESVTKVISFAIIMIAAIVLINLLGKLIENIISVVMLGWLNKLLGVVVAFCITALIVGLILSLINYANESWFTIISQEKINESLFYEPLYNLSQKVFPYLKEFLHFQ